jgi:tetratricopeptide (TPR) repeat protein
MRSVVIGVVALVAAAAVAVPTAMRCPELADAHVANGWSEYRAGRLASAGSAFASANARCPEHHDARVGLGYVALRNMAFDSARALFTKVLGGNPRHVDALVGLGLVEMRVEQYDSARARFTDALRIEPQRPDIMEHLGVLPPRLGPPPVRPPLVLPDSLVYRARINGPHFEVLAGGRWQPFYIKGVNLGAALPGRFPSEFPDAGVYADWVSEIAAMGANVIRVYTLHPPAFYQALADHNELNPSQRLWLLHGVWAELPPDDVYDDPAWEGDFFREIERVVDVLHGRADVPRRAGHAAGYYTADVSPWVLGFILGREWEPFSVAEYNLKRPALTGWQGEYLQVGGATAMDVWLARAMDHLVAYETRTYRQQRPVAYTNWPTLDPMRHPSELDVHQEMTIRGVPFDAGRVVHNEDEVALNGAAVSATTAFPAGYFAAYHIYPYYPDFFLLSEEYAETPSPFGGRSSYYGYLQDLKRHYPNTPIVVAEYGIPTSWGVAHLNPQGWHHGGHSEQRMAGINVRLTREIEAAGMAGGILFSWIDEWFKHTWLTHPFEAPSERNRMWWNKMNPEQHYGVLAVEPERRLGETAQARQDAWRALRPLYSAGGMAIRAHADEAFLWLHIEGPASAARRLLIGFDVVDPDGGGMRFPGADAPASPVGLEFVLEVAGGQARLMATPRANQFRLQNVPRGSTKRDHAFALPDQPPGLFTGSYTQVLNEPFDARRREDGRFDPLYAIINRARVGADSTNYLGYGYDRGVLPPGPLPDGAWERLPGGDVLEVRIPWTLINVTDPSSRHVVHEARGARPDDQVGTRQVDGIRIVAAAEDGMGWRVWPASGRPRDVASFTWTTWDVPRFRTRRRPVFDAMRAVFGEVGQAITVNQP